MGQLQTWDSLSCALLYWPRSLWPLLRRQVKDIISLRDKDDHSLLFLAVGSKSEIMFSAALTAVSDVGGDDEVRGRPVI